LQPTSDSGHRASGGASSRPMVSAASIAHLVQSCRGRSEEAPVLGDHAHLPPRRRLLLDSPRSSAATAGLPPTCTPHSSLPSLPPRYRRPVTRRGILVAFLPGMGNLGLDPEGVKFGGFDRRSTTVCLCLRSRLSWRCNQADWTWVARAVSANLSLFHPVLL